MDNFLRRFWPIGPAYKPVRPEDGNDEDNDPLLSQSRASLGTFREENRSFYWSYYAVFMLLGIAMLWAWNMFLAASPYFVARLSANPKLANNFQSASLTVSTIANLGVIILMTNKQKNASYPQRIVYALMINIATFLLLTASTIDSFRNVSNTTYFVFLMFIIFVSSGATGLMQNGIFAYMGTLGVDGYAQGNMTGQAIAGVLPCIVQIIAVLSVSARSDEVLNEQESKDTQKSAMAYFSTAVAVSGITLTAFSWLMHIENRATSAHLSATEEDPQARRSQRPTLQKIPLWTLYKKTFHLSTSVFLTFATSMFFPVFTLRIMSVQKSSSSRLSDPAVFQVLAFLLWNAGDLSGRLVAAAPRIRITHKPRLILALAIARITFVPGYLLCNVDGKGALIVSDAFYLVFVQYLFGLSNGYVGTQGMMGAGEYVSVEEREATGAFMTMMLVGGLAVGSALSFLASK